MTKTTWLGAAIVAAACILPACDKTTPEGPITKTTASSAPASTAAAAHDVACGSRENPCPMQRWMKTVMMPASTDRDPAKLSEALTYVAEHAPPGYTNWASIAGGAAAKAKAGDLDGAKTSCRECHDAYKDEYKKTMRDR